MFFYVSFCDVYLGPVRLDLSISNSSLVVNEDPLQLSVLVWRPRDLYKR